MQKITAWVTIILFLLTNSATAQPIRMPEVMSAELVQLPHSINIPENLGSIQDQFKASGSKPTIIYIQDAHVIWDAQNNIRALIEYFQKQFGVSLIAIEGGKGALDSTLLRAFPDEMIKKKVMRQYLERGELAGADLAAIFNPQTGRYLGIEDWDLYQNNYTDYLQAVKVQPDLLARLDSFKSSLKQQRQQVFSEDLNVFYEKTDAFREEKMSLIQFVEYLIESKIQIAQEKFPHLTLLAEAVKNESGDKEESFDASVRQMAESFHKRFSEKLDKPVNKEFQEKYQSFKTGQLTAVGFLKYLVDTARLVGAAPKLTLRMRQELGSAETLSAIKGTKLFEEIELFTAEAEQGLAVQPEAKALLEKYKIVRLLKGLAKLELTRDQWEELKQWKEDSLEALPFRMRDAFLQPARRYYELAEKRDGIFLDNLSQVIQQENTKAAIVLAGGFHARGFEQRLKANGYSYVIVTPKIESLEGAETYDKVMQGELSYREFLRTTYYDAFIRHAVIQLFANLNEPDFRSHLKMWRDQLIRDLAREGRIEETPEYTRYLDELLKMYHQKFAEAGSLSSPDEIIKAIEQEIEQSSGRIADNIWQRFQLQFGQFAEGLRQLSAQKSLTPQNIKSLLDRTKAAQGFTYAPPHALAKNPILFGMRGEQAGKALDLELPFARPEEIIDVLNQISQSPQTAPIPGLAARSEVRQAAEDLNRIGITASKISPAELPSSPNLGEDIAGTVRQIASALPADVRLQIEQQSAGRSVEAEVAKAIASNLEPVNVLQAASSKRQADAQPNVPAERTLKLETEISRSEVRSEGRENPEDSEATQDDITPIPEIDLNPFQSTEPPVQVQVSVLAAMVEIVQRGSAERQKREFGLLLFGKEGRITDFVGGFEGTATSVDTRSSRSEAIVKDWIARGYEFLGYFHNHPSSEEVTKTNRPMELQDLNVSSQDRKSYYVAHGLDILPEDDDFKESRWNTKVKPLEFIGGLLPGNRVLIGAHRMEHYREAGEFTTLYMAHPVPIMSISAPRSELRAGGETTSIAARRFSPISAQDERGILSQFNQAHDTNILNIVQSAIRKHPDRPVNILDLGSGAEMNLLRILKKRFGEAVSVTGVDQLSPNTGADKEGVNYRQGEGSALLNKMAQNGEQYDVVISHRAFRFFSNPMESLQNIKKILAPGGWASIHFLKAEDRIPGGLSQAVSNLQEPGFQIQKTGGSVIEEEADFEDPYDRAPMQWSAEVIRISRSEVRSGEEDPFEYFRRDLKQMRENFLQYSLRNQPQTAAYDELYRRFEDLEASIVSFDDSMKNFSEEDKLGVENRRTQLISILSEINDLRGTLKSLMAKYQRAVQENRQAESDKAKQDMDAVSKMMPTFQLLSQRAGPFAFNETHLEKWFKNVRGSFSEQGKLLGMDPEMAPLYAAYRNLIRDIRQLSRALQTASREIGQLLEWKKSGIEELENEKRAAAVDRFQSIGGGLGKDLFQIVREQIDAMNPEEGSLSLISREGILTERALQKSVYGRGLVDERRRLAAELDQLAQQWKDLEAQWKQGDFVLELPEGEDETISQAILDTITYLDRQLRLMGLSVNGEINRGGEELQEFLARKFGPELSGLQKAYVKAGEFYEEILKKEFKTDVLPSENEIKSQLMQKFGEERVKNYEVFLSLPGKIRDLENKIDPRSELRKADLSEAQKGFFENPSLTAYGNLSQDQIAQLRERFKQEFPPHKRDPWDKPFPVEKYFELLIQTSEAIKQKYPIANFLALGASGEWLVRTLEMLYPFPESESSPDYPYRYVAFSGASEEMGDAIDLYAQLTPEQKQGYQTYFSDKTGFNREFLDQSPEWVIPDYVRSGITIDTLLNLLEKDFQIPKETLNKKLAFYALRPERDKKVNIPEWAEDDRDRRDRFLSNLKSKQGYDVSEQYVDDDAIRSLSASESFFGNRWAPRFPPDQWAKGKPDNEAVPERAALMYFGLIDYLILKGKIPAEPDQIPNEAPVNGIAEIVSTARSELRSSETIQPGQELTLNYPASPTFMGVQDDQSQESWQLGFIQGGFSIAYIENIEESFASVSVPLNEWTDHSGLSVWFDGKIIKLKNNKKVPLQVTQGIGDLGGVISAPALPADLPAPQAQSAPAFYEPFILSLYQGGGLKMEIEINGDTIMFSYQPSPEGGIQQFKSFNLTQKKTFSIGRNPDFDIALNAGFISRKHAQILVSKEGDGYKVEIKDSGSTYGTFVGGQKIESNIPVTLKKNIQAPGLPAALEPQALPGPAGGAAVMPLAPLASHIENSPELTHLGLEFDLQRQQVLPTIYTMKHADAGLAQADPRVPKALQDFDLFEDANYEVLKLMMKSDLTLGDYEQLKNLMKIMVDRYLGLYQAQAALRPGNYELVQEVLPLFNQVIQKIDQMLTELPQGLKPSKPSDILPNSIAGNIRRLDANLTRGIIGIPPGESYSSAQLDKVGFHELINIVHQKGVRNLLHLMVGFGVAKRVLYVLQSVPGEQQPLKINLAYIDARAKMDQNPPLAMQHVAMAFAKGQRIHNHRSRFSPDRAEIFADEQQAGIRMKLGVHSARIQYSFQPTQEKGRIVVNYQDSYENHRGSEARLKIVKNTLEAMGFKTVVSGVRLDAYYDKDSASVHSMSELPSKLTAVVQLLSAIKDWDLQLNHYPQLDQVVQSLSERLIEDGYVGQGWNSNPAMLLPKLPLTVQQEMRKNAAIAGLDLGQGALGQKDLDWLTEQLEKLFARGSLQIDDKNQLRKVEAADESPIARFLKMIEGADVKVLDNMRRMAAIAQVVKDYGQVRIIGDVRGYQVLKIVLPVLGDDITFYTLKDPETGEFRLSYAVLGEFSQLKERYDRFRKRKLENNLLSEKDLREILTAHNMTHSLAFSDWLDELGLKEKNAGKNIFEVLESSSEFLSAAIPVFEVASLKQGVARNAISPTSVGGAAINQGKVIARVSFNAPYKSAEEFQGSVFISEVADVNDDEKMRQAAAIVVTTGGPLAHAAIQARELKKPGIILNGATLTSGGMEFQVLRGKPKRQEVAFEDVVMSFHAASDFVVETAALQDGDLVYVDATNGMFYLLSKAGDSSTDEVFKAYQRWKNSDAKSPEDLKKILSSVKNESFFRAIVDELISAKLLSNDRLRDVLSAFKNDPVKRETIAAFFERQFRAAHSKFLKDFESLKEYSLTAGQDLLGIYLTVNRMNQSKDEMQFLLTDQKTSEEDSSVQRRVDQIWGVALRMAANFQKRYQIKLLERINNVLGESEISPLLASQASAASAQSIPADQLSRILSRLARIGENIQLAGFSQAQSSDPNTKISTVMNLISRLQKIRENQLETAALSKKVMNKDELMDLYSRNIAGGKAANSAQLRKALSFLQGESDSRVANPQGFSVLASAYKDWKKQPNPNVLDQALKQEIARSYFDLVDRQRKDILEFLSTDKETKPDFKAYLEEVLNVNSEDVNDGLILAWRKSFLKFIQEDPSRVSPALDRYLKVFGAVAVRSSGIKEDDKGAAMAGQKATVLNVSRVENVAKAIINVWISGAESVLIDEMTNPETAVLAFSTDAVTQQPNIRITSAYGLTKGLVDSDGVPNPDVHVLRKNGTAPFKILQSRIGNKSKTVILDSESGVTRAVDTASLFPKEPAKAKQAALSQEQLQTVARVADYLAQYFGYPLDVEGAFRGNEFLIYQVRPITTINDAIKNAKQQLQTVPASLATGGRSELRTGEGLYSPLEALKDPGLYNFIRDMLIENYNQRQEFFPDEVMPNDIAEQEIPREEKIEMLVTRILDSLKNFKGDSITAAREINANIFDFADPESSFRKAEKKSFDQYFEADLKKEEQYTDTFLEGPVVADFGTGYGRFLLELADRAPPDKFQQFIGTDPYDYAKEFKDHAVQHPGFRFIRQTTENIPASKIGRNTVHAGRLASVIHHTYSKFQDPQNPESRRKVVQFLKSVYAAMAPGGRVSIYEDSYPENPSEEYAAGELIQDSIQQNLTEKFLALTPQQKYQYIVWNDWYWNLLYSGLYEMSMAYRYYTMEQWISIFQDAGFNVVEKQYWGFRRPAYHGASVTFFVIEKPARSGQDTRDPGTPPSLLPPSKGVGPGVLRSEVRSEKNLEPMLPNQKAVPGESQPNYLEPMLPQALPAIVQQNIILLREYRDRPRAHEYLVTVGRSATTIVVSLLLEAVRNEPDREYHFIYEYVLSDIGAPAVAQLVRALGDRNQYVRRTAGRALDQMVHQRQRMSPELRVEKIPEEALNLVLEALKNEPDSNYHFVFVDLLGRIGTPALPLLQSQSAINQAVDSAIRRAIDQIRHSPRSEVRAEKFREEWRGIINRVVEGSDAERLAAVQKMGDEFNRRLIGFPALIERQIAADVFNVEEMDRLDEEFEQLEIMKDLVIAAIYEIPTQDFDIQVINQMQKNLQQMSGNLKTVFETIKPAFVVTGPNGREEIVRGIWFLGELANKVLGFALKDLLQSRNETIRNQSREVAEETLKIFEQSLQTLIEWGGGEAHPDVSRQIQFGLEEIRAQAKPLMQALKAELRAYGVTDLYEIEAKKMTLRFLRAIQASRSEIRSRDVSQAILGETEQITLEFRSDWIISDSPKRREYVNRFRQASRNDPKGFLKVWEELATGPAQMGGDEYFFEERNSDIRLSWVLLEATAAENFSGIVPSLAKFLTNERYDTFDYLQTALAELAGRFKDARLVPALMVVLSSRYRGPQEAAKQALAAIGQPALPALFENFWKTELHESIIQILGWIGDVSALPMLEEAYARAKDNEDLRAVILESVGHLQSPESVLFLLRALESEPAGLVFPRQAAFMALGESAAEDQLTQVLQPIEKELNNESAVLAHRISALQAALMLSQRFGYTKFPASARETISRFYSNAASQPRLRPGKTGDQVIHASFKDPQELLNYVDIQAELAFSIIPPPDQWALNRHTFEFYFQPVDNELEIFPYDGIRGLKELGDPAVPARGDKALAYLKQVGLLDGQGLVFVQRGGSGNVNVTPVFWRSGAWFGHTHPRGSSGRASDNDFITYKTNDLDLNIVRKALGSARSDVRLETRYTGINYNAALFDPNLNYSLDDVRTPMGQSVIANVENAVQFILAGLPANKSSEIQWLDLATGRGLVPLSVLKEADGKVGKFVAVDLSPKMLQSAEKRLKEQFPEAATAVEFRQGDLTKLGDAVPASEKFDVITIAHTLNFFRAQGQDSPDLEFRKALFNQLKSYLKDGGQLVIIGRSFDEYPWKIRSRLYDDVENDDLVQLGDEITSDDYHQGLIRNSYEIPLKDSGFSNIEIQITGRLKALNVLDVPEDSYSPDLNKILNQNFWISSTPVPSATEPSADTRRSLGGGRSELRIWKDVEITEVLPMDDFDVKIGDEYRKLNPRATEEEVVSYVQSQQPLIKNRRIDFNFTSGSEYWEGEIVFNSETGWILSVFPKSPLTGLSSEEILDAVMDPNQGMNYLFANDRHRQWAMPLVESLSANPFIVQELRLPFWKPFLQMLPDSIQQRIKGINLKNLKPKELRARLVELILSELSEDDRNFIRIHNFKRDLEEEDLAERAEGLNSKINNIIVDAIGFRNIDQHALEQALRSQLLPFVNTIEGGRDSNRRSLVINAIPKNGDSYVYVLGSNESVDNKYFVNVYNENTQITTYFSLEQFLAEWPRMAGNPKILTELFDNADEWEGYLQNKSLPASWREAIEKGLSTRSEVREREELEGEDSLSLILPSLNSQSLADNLQRNQQDINKTIENLNRDGEQGRENLRSELRLAMNQAINIEDLQQQKNPQDLVSMVLSLNPDQVTEPLGRFKNWINASELVERIQSVTLVAAFQSIFGGPAQAMPAIQGGVDNKSLEIARFFLNRPDILKQAWKEAFNEELKDSKELVFALNLILNFDNPDLRQQAGEYLVNNYEHVGLIYDSSTLGKRASALRDFLKYGNSHFSPVAIRDNEKVSSKELERQGIDAPYILAPVQIQFDIPKSSPWIGQGVAVKEGVLMMGRQWKMTDPEFIRLLTLFIQSEKLKGNLQLSQDSIFPQIDEQAVRSALEMFVDLMQRSQIAQKAFATSA